MACFAAREAASGWGVGPVGSVKDGGMWGEVKLKTCQRRDDRGGGVAVDGAEDRGVDSVNEGVGGG